MKRELKKWEYKLKNSKFAIKCKFTIFYNE